MFCAQLVLGESVSGEELFIELLGGTEVVCEE